MMGTASPRRIGPRAHLVPSRALSCAAAGVALAGTVGCVTRIGFLSFGHWQAARGSQTRSARDALVQTIELAEAAEELGLDGAFVRVHHFARQLASPFPLLAAIGARTSRIEIGTGVIDMRYENPLYMAEEAAAADLISGGRLQLGISRGSPEPALRGAEAFGYVPAEGRPTPMSRARTRAVPRGDRRRGRRALRPGDDRLRRAAPGPAAVAGARRPDLVGLGHAATAAWTAEQGMNLMSSTLLTEDTGVPFDELQAEQIAIFRSAWAEAGWEREPRVSVSRSVIPIVSDLDRAYFGDGAAATSDQVGFLDGGGRAVRAQLHRRAGRDRRASSPATPPCARRTRCCSPCPTSSASRTTRGCSRRSPSTSPRRSGGSPPRVADTRSAPLNSRAMFHVRRADQIVLATPAAYAPHSSGHRRAEVVGQSVGSLHTGITQCALDAGGAVGEHLHSFEKSFYVLEGRPRLTVDGRTWQLDADDCGLVPLGSRTPGGWRRTAGPRRWIEASAPGRARRARLAGHVLHGRARAGGAAEHLDIRDPRTRTFFRLEPGQMELDNLRIGAPVDAPTVSASMATALLAYSGIALKMLVDTA